MSPAQPSFARELPYFAADLAVLALAWYAADAWAHLQLTVQGYFATWGIWAICWAVAQAGAFRWPAWRWLWTTVAYAVPGVLLAWISSGFKHPLSIGAIAGSLVLMWAVRWGWRAWRVEGSVWSELTRRLGLLGGAVYATYPFFTDLVLGGVDARWYLAMLRDFIEQARAGVFPVFVGQGLYAYNGAVHPIRSAPIFMWSAGILDLVTWRSLSDLSLQHMTVVGATIAGAFGMYAGLTTLVPGRRWLAAGVALACIWAPGLLAPVYMADMYMTHMAGAALPLAVFGAARLVQTRFQRGSAFLAAGLALCWMCHPPTGLLASLAAMAVLALAWAWTENLPVPISALVKLGLCFAGLGGYYFATMSELPPRPGDPAAPALLVVGGILLGAIGVIRGVWYGQRAAWGALAAGLLLTGVLQPVWATWILAFALLFAVFRWWRSKIRADGGMPLVWAATMAAAAAAAAGLWPIWGRHAGGQNLGALGGLKRYSARPWALFEPLSRDLGQIWDFHPGWTILGLLLCAAWWGWRRRSAFMLGAVSIAVIILLCLERVPGTSEFLVAYFPEGISGIINLPLAERLMHVLTAFGAVGGYLALAETSVRRPALTAVGLAIALVWSGVEVAKFVHRGVIVTMTRPLSARRVLPENLVLDRFAYDLLNIPDYYSNGKTDPRFETRLLDVAQHVVIGPDEIAQRMETEPPIELGCSVHEINPVWLRIPPKIWVGPGETRFLRFQFRPDRNYSGYLVLTTLPGNYREYQLPLSGMPKSFGTQEGCSKVLTLLNSTEVPAVYEITESRAPENNLDTNGPSFATVALSLYNPEKSPIRMESFIPYRVSVDAAVDGFVETPRMLLPGYRAWLDGQPVKLQKSIQKLAMVPVKAGHHRIELRYTGTLRVWTAAVVSAATWLLFAVWCWYRLPRSKDDGVVRV